MNQVIIGYGEIGRAIHELIGDADIVEIDSPIYEVEYDIMHVCIPYSNGFIMSLLDYIEQLGPKHVVIYSTLPIGTTSLFVGAVHSPIEGKHPNLGESVRVMERWIGASDASEGAFFQNYFKDLGLRTRLLASPDFTEALKLLSTTEYGINIEFARYKKHVADSLGMNYELMKDFNREYNRLYKALGMDDRYQKYVLDAPDGPKGGHCVTPNARLLAEQYPNEMVKIVGEL